MREGRGWPWRAHKTVPSEVRELEQDLARTRVDLAQAYAGFNAAGDGELVESYIYEIQALRARYSYLLRQRKALEPPDPAEVSAPAEAPALAPGGESAVTLPLPVA